MKNVKLKFKETEIGPIPEDWNVFSIQQVSEVIGGGTPSTSDPNNFGGDIPWITPRDLSNYAYRYISRGERNITLKGLNSSNAKIIPEDAILLTTRAPVGYLAIAKNQLTTNQGFHSLVPNEKTDNRFLYYLLKNNVHQLIDNASGSTFLELNGGTLKSLRFAFPPISEQSRIVEILSSLDDKIELNQQINDNLEKLSNITFKKWFADNLPEEFNHKSLDKEIKESINGDWGKESESNEFGERVFCIRGADIAELKNGGVGKMPTRFIKEKNLAQKQLCDGDVVIEISGGSPTQSTGRSVLITNELLSRFEYPLICSNFCKIIRFKEKNHSGFYYTFLNEAYNRGEFFQYENGTSGIKNLDIASFFKNTQFIAADKKILEYNLFFRDIYRTIQKNGNQNYNLLIIKNSILPKLMSGKIRVE